MQAKGKGPGQIHTIVLSPGAAFPYLVGKENKRGSQWGISGDGERAWLGAGDSDPPPAQSWSKGSGSLLHGLQASIHGSRPGWEVGLGLEWLGRCSQEQAIELGRIRM